MSYTVLLNLNEEGYSRYNVKLYLLWDDVYSGISSGVTVNSV